MHKQNQPTVLWSLNRNAVCQAIRLNKLELRHHFTP